MLWIINHPRAWRKATLFLMVAAFLGPWVFDRIHVPAEYACDPPFVRLEGDFCGVPLPGTWMVFALSSEFVNLISRLIMGRLGFAESSRGLMIILLAIVFLLPAISTFLLIVRGNHRRLQSFQIGVLCLAGSLMLWVLSATPDLRIGRLWGPWLYTGVVFSVLILEALVFARGKGPGQSG